MKRVFIALCVVVLTWGTALASGSSERLYPPGTVTGSNTPPAVAVDANGNVAMAGTVEHSPGGNDWSIIYYQHGKEIPSQSTQDFSDCDTAYGVAVIDSKIIAVGSQGSNSSNKDWKVAEIDPVTGEIAWQDYWDNNGNNDEAKAIALDGTTAVVAGYTNDGTKTSVRIHAYDTSSGTRIWSKTLDRSSDEFANFIDTGKNHFAVIGGTSNNSTASSWLLMGIKTLDGELLWEKRGPDLPTGKMLDMAVSQDGKVAAVGYTYSGHDHLWTVVLLSPEGEVLWTNKMDVASEAKGVAFDSLGRVVVAGFVEDGSRRNLKVVWYNTAGDEALSKTYDGGNNDEAYDVACDLAGDVVVTGYTYNGSDKDILVITYNKEGDQLWSDTIGETSYNESGRRVVVSKTGEATVVGVVQSVGGYEWQIVRYKGHVLTHTLQTAEVRALALKENPDVEKGDYLGLGSVANNGTQMKVNISLPLYVDSNDTPVSVNVYFAIAIDTYLYILQPDGSFSTTTLTPWKKGITSPLDASILPEFSVVNPITGELLLPEGDYIFYILVVPSTVKEDLSDFQTDGLWELTYSILTLGK
jgi:hypothetical protein